MTAWKMSVRSLAPLVAICWLALAAQSARGQQTFSYGDFSSTAGLTLNGTAATAGSGPGTVLRLTPSAGNQLGTVFYSTAQPLTAGFTTTFTFQISQPGGIAPADGFAFVVQNSTSKDNAKGGLGGSIGYGDDDANNDFVNGISNSVAVEFDTFQNGWDANANHVAVMSCGTGHNSQHHDANCQDGTLANPTRAIKTALPVTLSDGHPHTVVITYTLPCSACQNLTVTLDGIQILATAFDVTSIGLGPNGSAFVGFTASTGGGFNNQDIVSWNFSSQTITEPVSVKAPTTFAFSNAQGSELTHTVDFTPPDGQLQYPLNDPTTIQIQSTNTAVDSVTWPQYVHGGPLAPSILFPLVDDNPGGTGTNGGLFVDLCFDPTLTSNPIALTPSDKNCPFVPSTNDNLLGINIVADIVAKPAIVPGTTSVLAHYEPNTTATTTWSPTPIDSTPNPACVTTTGSSSDTKQPSPPVLCDVLDIQQQISGDQTTSSGRVRSKGTFAFAYNVPMLLSTVSVNGTQVNTPPANINTVSAGLWFSAAQAPLSLSFLVNPACIPGACPSPGASPANNFFNPAPVASETFDVTKTVGTSVVVVVPTTPANPPLNFNTASTQPVTFTASLTAGQVPDGQYLLEWSASDNVGILEQNQQRVPVAIGQATCPDGSPVPTGGFCYTTSLFSAQLNVDSTPPTITPTFTPASTGNIFAVGAAVQVHFGCADATSGIASCLSTGSGLTDGGAINTSSSQVGAHTFTITATDKAGNTATQSVQYQVVASSELFLLNIAKPSVRKGSNLTYNIAVLNLGPATADNVVVTDTLPAGTSFVSAGYGIVSCIPGGCSDMNGPGSACMVSGNTVTCNIPTVGVLFRGFTGALVKITVNVSTATAGTVLKDTATVRAANTDPFLGDNSATARTEVCSATGSCPGRD